MANDLNGRVWAIDTAGATSAVTHAVKIKKMIWHEPTTTGHVILIKDGASGKTIWAKTVLAAGSGMDELWDIGTPLWLTGFYVTTLDSGTLYVYIE